MVLNDVGAGQLKSHQIVDDKFHKRLQKEWLPSHWRTVQSLALLVAQCLFDNLDTKFRILVIHPVVRIFQITEEPFNSLFSLYVGDDCPIPDPFGVL